MRLCVDIRNDTRHTRFYKTNPYRYLGALQNCNDMMFLLKICPTLTNILDLLLNCLIYLTRCFDKSSDQLQAFKSFLAFFLTMSYTPNVFYPRLGRLLIHRPPVRHIWVKVTSCFLCCLSLPPSTLYIFYVVVSRKAKCLSHAWNAWLDSVYELFTANTLSLWTYSNTNYYPLFFYITSIPRWILYK